LIITNLYFKSFIFINLIKYLKEDIIYIDYINYMNCKYCHLNTHYIDKCPTIICKNCKEIGHPQWLCKLKKNNKNNINNFEKKYSFSDEIKKKPSENFVEKNIKYYLNMENMKWGDLISI